MEQGLEFLAIDGFTIKSNHKSRATMTMNIRRSGTKPAGCGG